MLNNKSKTIKEDDTVDAEFSRCYNLRRSACFIISFIKTV